MSSPSPIGPNTAKTASRRVGESILARIGNTPLLRLASIGSEFENVEICGKAEWFNPGGSVKDRPALGMIDAGLKSGKLTPGKTIIDATSGNTGIAYAMIGAALGYPVTLCLPDSASHERKRMLAAYGAELVMTPGDEATDGAIRRVQQMVAADPEKYFYPDQYGNPANWLAHYHGTANEIWDQTIGRVTHFVAGLGTSGTCTGTGRRLHELNPKIFVAAVEPAEPMHGLEGLKHMGSSIIPAIYDPAVHDEKLSITTDEGWAVTDRLLHEEGLAVGHSSGGNMAGALRLAQRLHENKQTGVIVTLFADRADRYFEPRRWERTFTWP